MRKLGKRWANFFVLNFATPVVFFWAFRAYGAKPAISFAIGVTLVQVLAHWVRRVRFSPFFIIASGFTVLFGTMDLLVASPRFFRFEPFVHNLAVGGAFAGSLVLGRPLLIWFARELPEEVRPVLDTDGEHYLRRMTLVWTVYLLLKAFFFLYLALVVDLGTLIVLRSVIGGGTLWLLAAGEIAYRKWWKPGRARRRGGPRRLQSEG